VLYFIVGSLKNLCTVDVPNRKVLISEFRKIMKLLVMLLAEKLILEYNK